MPISPCKLATYTPIGGHRKRNRWQSLIAQAPSLSCPPLGAQGLGRLEARPFSFDRVFPSDATQTDVFAQVRPLVEGVVSGYNATVMAYGSTGSGKTHSIMGQGGIDAALESSGAVGPGSGVLARTVSALFSRIADRAAEREFTVRLSYVELYNNNFRDLLHKSTAAGAAVMAENTARSLADAFDGAGVDDALPASSGQQQTMAERDCTSGPKISIRESRSRGVFLEGSPTLRVPVSSVVDCLRLVSE